MPSSSPSSRLPAEKRKSQLLDAAAQVFARRGYAGTTTAELAKEAGITEPIIYRHFKGKRELFVALIERTGDGTIAEWEESMKDAHDPAERISRLLSANPMVVSKGRAAYRVIVQAMMDVEEVGVREALQGHIAKLHAFLVGEVKAAQDSGMVSKRFSPEITGWALMHLAIGYGVLHSLHIPSHAIDKAGNHVADVIGMLMLGERYKPQ
ncbi:MAG: TetR/AcrR family transcriptional regulator [Phycisphaerales bacterium]